MITRPARIKVALAAFFLQASWSFEKMQGLGFASAISPALKEIYAGDDSGLVKAMKRHLVFYNAHPYMASPVLGASVNMEERARDGNAGVEDAARFKKMVTGAYGAIGDNFFWGSLRPLASIIGVVATLLWGVWGPVVFLVVYNSAHLWMRFHGFEKGLELGPGVVGYIKSLALPRWAERGRRAASVLVGIVAAFAAVRFAGLAGGEYAGPSVPAAAVVLSVALALIIGTIQRRGIRVSTLVYITLPPLVLYGLASG